MDLRSRRSDAGWQDGGNALGDIEVDGEAFALDARGQLRATVAAWQQQHGLTPMVGIELEAYVFEQGEDGAFRPYNTPGAFVYGTGPHNDPRGLMDAIWTRAEAAEIPIESMNGEYDNGQFELTLCFGDAIKACDDAFLLKTMAREVAAEKGLILTFLPNPSRSAARPARQSASRQGRQKRCRAEGRLSSWPRLRRWVDAPP